MANFTGNQIRHTFERVVQTDPASTGNRGMLQDGFGRPLSASIMALSVSESLNVTGNAAITGSTYIQGDINVTGDGTLLGDLIVGGTVTAQEFFTEYVNSSVVYESGSTKFGDTVDDTHIRTGSLLITGSITSTGNLTNTGDLTISGSTTVTETAEIKKGTFGAFFANPQILDEDITIPSRYNSRLFGPITVAAGKTLTIGANAKLEITDI